LIDLGRTFIVFTEGADPDGPPHQRMLYRLEATRKSIEFVDKSRLSEKDCEAILEEQLKDLTECDIVGVEFPFFGPGDLERTKYVQD
jgi:hypothetical protein